MKINDTPPPNQIRPAEPTRIDKKPGAGAVRNDASAPGASVPSQTTVASQDIDTARVNEIREAIREGRLNIKVDKIGEGLIDNVRDMLSGKTPR